MVGELLKGQFSLGFPTIFQELEYYNDKNISNFILPISYERFDETCEYIKSTIELAEKCLSTYEKVKEYGARRFYFPVGHHAFRIPVLLSGPEWDDVRARYIDFVRDTGMVRSYDTFVEEVLPAARELKISR